MENRSKRIWRRPAGFRGSVVFGLLLGAAVLLLSAGEVRAGNSEKQPTDDLLTGYSLLASSISSESQMKYLLWLREITLQGPGAQVEGLMKEIYEASSDRSKELEELRKLSPPTTAEPPPSPIGTAIQDSAAWAGTKEMLFPGGQFGMRFVFLQAQATRMITVIAEQTAKIEPNSRRKKWLEEVAKQYADFREELVKAVEKCGLQ